MQSTDIRNFFKIYQPTQKVKANLAGSMGNYLKTNLNKLKIQEQTEKMLK